MAAKSNAIELNVESSSPEKVRTGVLVVGAFADGTLPPSSRKVDDASKGKLSAAIKRGGLDERAGTTRLLHDLAGSEAERGLLVRFGKREDSDDKAFS